MSTSDSIVFSQTKQSSWRRSDTAWTLGPFGTAIGVGVLFLPIHVGFSGLISILLMLVLAYPITFYCHRALAHPCPSSSNPSGNTTEAVEEHFGKTGGMVITFLCLLAIYPLLWIYSVTITSISVTFWESQLDLAPLNRGSVALFLLPLMTFVIWFSEDLMVRMVDYLVWPFITSLVPISLLLTPYWDSVVTNQADLGSLSLTGHDGILITVWLGISIMVFSLNFSPVVSSLVISKCEKYGRNFGHDFTERKCSQITSHASMLMAVVVIFFAFSCLFTLSPANMVEAKVQDIPVLSYLANHFASITGTKTTFVITLECAASIIALVAIFKPFFGHYLGTLEGPNDLILKSGYRGDRTKVSLSKLNTVSMIFIMDFVWVVTYTGPSILDLAETMDAPIIASLPCLLSMYVIHRAPSLAKCRGRLDNMLVTVIGLLTTLNIVYELF